MSTERGVDGGHHRLGRGWGEGLRGQSFSVGRWKVLETMVVMVSQ